MLKLYNKITIIIQYTSSPAVAGGGRPYSPINLILTLRGMTNYHNGPQRPSVACKVADLGYIDNDTSCDPTHASMDVDATAIPRRSSGNIHADGIVLRLRLPRSVRPD